MSDIVDKATMFRGDVKIEKGTQDGQKLRASDDVIFGNFILVVAIEN